MRCSAPHSVSALLVAATAATASADIYPMNARSTYLRTNEDAPLPALVVPLAGRSFSPGDLITITALGDFRVGNAWTDQYVSMTAIFSSSDTLLAPTNLHRVPSAIDAAEDFVTSATFYGPLTTDISEDFKVGMSDLDRTVTVAIPDGATHLFIGIVDSYMGDNTDPDGDLAVAINEVPEPASLGLLALGLALLRRRS